MYMVQGIFCTCFYVGCVTRLKVSNRVSRLRLVQENFVKRGISIKCFFPKKKKNKTKNEALEKLKRKKYFLENVFPNIFFFCLRLAIRLYFN